MGWKHLKHGDSTHKSCDLAVKTVDFANNIGDLYDL